LQRLRDMRASAMAILVVGGNETFLSVN